MGKLGTIVSYEGDIVAQSKAIDSSMNWGFGFEMVAKELHEPLGCPSLSKLYSKM
jgi:hypothetical protein